MIAAIHSSISDPECARSTRDCVNDEGGRRVDKIK